ncbi:hypothetical protein [Parabacteroides sp. FAFU027]|uniref:hypothetical protein n=1 Tax=Parabacteroides sp. FAFU027 TaxID=2922715 RepID=UPI001FAF0E38|nr:hypothetical protein [Parabacteroides sp. FAFU027]
MKEDFDFKNIGKRMPYEVPDDFFEETSEKIMAEYERRKAPKAKVVHLKRWISAVAAVLVLGSGVWFAFYQNRGLDSPLAYNQKEKDSSIVNPAATKEQKTTKAQQKQVVFSPKQDKTSRSEKANRKQSPKAEKAETLDDALKSLSREELEQLNGYSENDFINEE